LPELCWWPWPRTPTKHCMKVGGAEGEAQFSYSSMEAVRTVSCMDVCVWLFVHMQHHLEGSKRTSVIVDAAPAVLAMNREALHFYYTLRDRAWPVSTADGGCDTAAVSCAGAQRRARATAPRRAGRPLAAAPVCAPSVTPPAAGCEQEARPFAAQVTHVHAAFICGSAQCLPVLLRACALGSAGAWARGVRVHLKVRPYHNLFLSLSLSLSLTLALTLTHTFTRSLTHTLSLTRQRWREKEHLRVRGLGI
jgi:hypothetical protein